MTHDNAIQWDWFPEMESSIKPRFPQHRHQTRECAAFLHEGKKDSPNNVLASRNLLRGIQLELPSGIDVAEKLGVNPINIEDDEPRRRRTSWRSALQHCGRGLRGLAGGDFA